MQWEGMSKNKGTVLCEHGTESCKDMYGHRVRMEVAQAPYPKYRGDQDCRVSQTLSAGAGATARTRAYVANAIRICGFVVLGWWSQELALPVVFVALSVCCFCRAVRAVTHSQKIFI